MRNRVCVWMAVLVGFLGLLLVSGFAQEKKTYAKGDMVKVKYVGEVVTGKVVSAKIWFIRLFWGLTRYRVDFQRHLSDVQWLQGDISICCNAPARRSGGRLCWEATCQGISWSPMRQWRVSPSPRF